VLGVRAPAWDREGASGERAGEVPEPPAVPDAPGTSGTSGTFRPRATGHRRPGKGGMGTQDADKDVGDCASRSCAAVVSAPGPVCYESPALTVELRARII
jgi:hypothetical protein